MATAYFLLRVLRQKRQRRQAEKELKLEKECIKCVPQVNLDFKKCRVCLKEGRVKIFGDTNTPDISDDLRIFGDIELSEDDCYPKYICDACYSLLQKAVLLRKCAKESDELLRQNASMDHKISNFSEIDDNSLDYESQGLTAEIEPKEKEYSCKSCKINFTNWEKYVKHKNSKRHKNIRIQCPMCYGLLTLQSYKKHLARHQSASHLVCDVCGKLYRKDNLVRHLQMHNFELPFQCTQCPYRGRFLESLKIHMRTHSGIKPFTCEMCQLRFLTRSNLNRHLLTHKKEKPFKCAECGRGFYSKGDMEIHFKSDHAGIKDFGCRVCGSKYGTRKALMRHELRVHKRDKMAKGRMPLYLRSEYKKA